MDFTTLSAQKAYQGITATTYDGVLTALIPSASDAIRRFCRQDFDLKTYTEYYEANGGRLLLRHTPIVSLTSITFGPDSGSPQTYDGTNYIVDPLTGIVRVKPTATAYLSGYPAFYGCYDPVQVVYQGGYASIPPSVVTATNMLVANMFNASRKDMTVQSEKIGDYSYTLQNGFKSMSEDIQGMLAPFVDYCIYG